MSTGTDTGAADGRPTVFLSYAREDETLARRLAAALEAAGLRVWWDALMEGGATYARSIEAALRASDAVVVAWSRHSVESDWVRDEAATGRDLHKLVPVSLDGTLPPLGFGQYHSVDLAHWSGEARAPEIDAVVRGVATAMGRPGGAPVADAAPRDGAVRPGLSRRRLLVAAAGAVAAGAVGVVAWRRGLVGGQASAGNSVAVLPFENLSGDPGQDFFADGLAEEVRATLARNARLLVMAGTSSAKFRERTEGAVAIAQELGVAYLLDGSVRRSGDVVRVAAALVDGRTGFTTWSESFQRRMVDIFAVQGEIATTVASALSAKVATAEADPLARTGGTTDVAAFEAYLRGRALYDLSADEASERAALAQFDAAIAADPAYAAAHAARARSLTAIANQYGEVGELDALYGAAIAAAERAIELAPGLAEAHSTLGFTLFQGRLDARAARQPFDRSRALGAGDATVMARFAQYCARVGRPEEAAESIARALQLDPLNPLIHRARGSIAYAARDWAGSIPPLRQALAMNPKMSRAHAAVGDALVMLGRPETARGEYAAEPAADFRLAGQAILYRRLGDRAAAERAFATLVADGGDRVLYQQAQVLAQWGDLEAALARLERARGIGDSGLVYARNDPFLDPLRGDARFRRLLLGIGFA